MLNAETQHGLPLVKVLRLSSCTSSALNAGIYLYLPLSGPESITREEAERIGELEDGRRAMRLFSGYDMAFAIMKIQQL